MTRVLMSAEGLIAILFRSLQKTGFLVNDEPTRAKRKASIDC